MSIPSFCVIWCDFEKREHQQITDTTSGLTSRSASDTVQDIFIGLILILPSLYLNLFDCLISYILRWISKTSGHEGLRAIQTGKLKYLSLFTLILDKQSHSFREFMILLLVFFDSEMIYAMVG
ncbi:unnamed protein product [Albugo candida]|uniref:Uncharacterized protein n=1 Tax=Albugo candida TaxID=65357 RepID=A0A024FUY7_9STRA|nr:unnamed protein product [Albugo candida]|eukprot:CCI10958.1 unnamed protein product [Albugo candida]